MTEVPSVSLSSTVDTGLPIQDYIVRVLQQDNTIVRMRQTAKPSHSDRSRPNGLRTFGRLPLRRRLSIRWWSSCAHVFTSGFRVCHRAMTTFWSAARDKNGDYAAKFTVLGSKRSDDGSESLLLTLVDADESFDGMRSARRRRPPLRCPFRIVAKMSAFVRIHASYIYSVQPMTCEAKFPRLETLNGCMTVPPTLSAPWIVKREERRTRPAVSAASRAAHAVAEPPAKAAPEPVDKTDAIPSESTRHPSDTAAVTHPSGKRMKLVKVTRTFTENGYQMTETVNELVPCDETDVPSSPRSDAPASVGASRSTLSTPAKKAETAKPTTGKQSSMMSFFQKK